MDRLGIFGGTFDPPHRGHLVLAEAAAEQLHLSLLLWVLTPDPPHKKEQKITPWQIRMEMVLAAIASKPQFALSRVDIDRPPPYFAVDTVLLLRESYPSHELVYLLGADSLRDLPRWHSPELFIESIDWLGVMRRPRARYNLEELEKGIKGLSSKILWIDAPLMNISSTRLRKSISVNHECTDEIPAEVCRIINKYGLYENWQR